MDTPHAFWQMPPAALFHFPPHSDPASLPAPRAGSFANAPLFSIPDGLFSAALDAWVPLTIAAIYAVTAKLLNKYNRSTGRRPWKISRSRWFFYFVVLHNVFLAVYSAWTWWGMYKTLRRVVANPFDEPSTTGGWAAAVDSVCRLNGSPGLGNGIYYDDAAGIWLTQSATNATAVAITPDRNQLGRMWNEGLAFYGWIFYLSKFYEVLDTFIILAKGRYSSTLQTYHHAGAMMCMWAGMRYMSAPVWLFVFVNSGIHTMMYTYYTFTTFSIRVPNSIKRSLTTMQILQFVLGAIVAMSHSFVFYTVPTTPPAAGVSPPGSADRAAGSPPILGAIKNMLSGSSSEGVSVTAPGVTQAAQSGYNAVPCIANTGETFAIWLNVVYLAPLTYLFVKFFITSYMRRSNAEPARSSRRGKKDSSSLSDDSCCCCSSSATTTGQSSLAATIATTEAQVRHRLSNVGSLAEKAGWDAAMNLEKEMYGDSSEVLGTGEKASTPPS